MSDIPTRVIFIVNYPVRAQEYSFLGIELFLQNSFAVEIWNLSPVLNPEIFIRQGDVTQPRPDKYSYRLISAKKDFEREVARLGGNDFIFMNVGCNRETLFVYRAIGRQKVRSGSVFNLLEFYFDSGGGHIGVAPFCGTVSFLDRLKKATIGKIIARFSAVCRAQFIKSLDLGFRFIRPYLVTPLTLILRGGNKSGEFLDVSGVPVSFRTKTILAHSMDYDFYLLQKDLPRDPGKKNTAVFLDGDFCFHPNYIRSNCGVSATPEIYFPELCRFFKEIESKWNVEVVIAAHPRASGEYERRDYFEGRKVVSCQTPRLVAESQFVILHWTMSIGYAVLFKKPAIFITTDQLKNGPEARFIENEAAYFGKKTVNISDRGEITSFLENAEFGYDEKIYDEYRDNYIKSPGTPEELRWKLVIDYLKTL